MKIAPSILNADYLNLGKAIKTVEQAGADLLHIDICLLYTSDAADE